MGALKACLTRVDRTRMEQTFRSASFNLGNVHLGLNEPREALRLFMKLRNLTPENFATVETLRHRYEDRLTAILSAGQTAGIFRIAEPRIATMAIIAMLTGVNTWFRQTGRLSLDEIEDIYWGMTRRLVAA